MGRLHQIYLSIGGNIGDRESYLRKASALLIAELGALRKQSQIYETAAWGLENQAPFLNQVLQMETTKTPQESIATCLAIEAALGRERLEKWGPRPIDIDILFYDDVIVREDNLEIPHSRLHLRNFVLIPLLEIAGDLVHPVLQQNIESLYLSSNDPLEVILKD